MQTLKITPAAAELGLVVTHHIVTDWHTEALPAGFLQLERATCARLAEQYTPDFVTADPILQGFRDLRKAVGRSVKKFPCSIEGLIGMVQRRGALPSIHPIVDIYNLVSLETRLTLGAHDLNRVTGDITLKIVNGDEPFVPLGSDRPEPVQPGEYAYVDDGGDVLCRMDYKQCERTKLTAGTSRCLVIIQGNANTPREMLEQAKARLVELLSEFGDRGSAG